MSQFIFIPRRGLSTASTAFKALGRKAAFPTADVPISHLLKRLGTTASVVDSLPSGGAHLIQISDAAMKELKASMPEAEGSFVPVVKYYPMVHRASTPRVAAAGETAKVETTEVTVTSATGRPVPHSRVVAFADWALKAGVEAHTDSDGRAKLNLQGNIDRLYVYGPDGFWGFYNENVSSKSVDVKLEPISNFSKDALRHFYEHDPQAGQHVTVAVVDTGCAAHPNLHVEGGRCTVKGESDATDFRDYEGHGTHCAGIIASRHPLYYGVAPAVTLRAYRVFGKQSEEATNFDIMKAIDHARIDGCDLVNISLGGGSTDPGVEEAMQRAWEAGTVTFAATGNDGRDSVCAPANSQHALAVSAMGRIGTFPKESCEEADVGGPTGADPNNFVAAFSNVGPQTSFTGVGVGIISCALGGGWKVMSGTSMATPAVCGVAARLLSRHPEILESKRDANRSEAIRKLVLAASKDLGFPCHMQGSGLPHV